MKRKSYLYRKIWSQAYGDIPKDENGISYDIHHINGDKTDNRLANLKCVSLKEHFDIHLKNGDYKACALIAGRMNNPNLKRMMNEKAKEKISLFQRKKVKDGVHHLLSGDIQRKANKERVNNRTHNFLNKEWHKTKNRKLVENGTHPLLRKPDGTSIGGNSSKERVKNGTHHFQNSDIQKSLSERAKLVNQKPVVQMTKDDLIVKEYKSVSDILIGNPSFKSTIYKKINSGKEYKGFIWKYK